MQAYKALLLLALLFPANRAMAAGHGGGFLSVLHRGDAVGVVEKGGTYELTVIPGVEHQQYKVVEVGQDYVELSSPGVTLRIPIYAIRSIKITKL